MSKASVAARKLRGVLAAPRRSRSAMPEPPPPPRRPARYGVGFITENTGPLAAAGVSYHRGAQLAVDEINECGWIGQGVKLKLSERKAAPTRPAPCRR